MVVTILAAYGMSRSGSFGHRTILWIMMSTMFFNAGIIPLFLVVSALGGYDQYWALIARFRGPDRRPMTRGSLLVDTAPANCWEDAFPVGNGRRGALVPSPPMFRPRWTRWRT